MKKLLLFTLLSLFIFNLSAVPPLTTDEEKGMIYTVEAQKFAKDLYKEFNLLWELEVFNTVSEDQQKQIDIMEELLKSYEIESPLQEGLKYTNPYFTKIYKKMIKNAYLSMYEALYIAVSVEEMDIFDLNELITKTENSDLIDTYNILKLSSIAHIRIYNKLLRSYGNPYIAQFMTPEELDAILYSR